jgi:sugar phosphate isomerase/epimerase
MASDSSIPASLSLDGLASDARSAFDLASESRYHGIAFPTNHPELTPDALGQSARRHIKILLANKNLAIDAIRIAAPKGALADPATIDRTLDNAQKAFLLARDLGVTTVSLNVGNLSDNKIPQSTLVAALREVAQHADAAGLTLALGSETSEHLRSLLKAVDYDRARANIDTARLIANGEDPLVVAETLAGIIGQVTAADAIRAGHSVRATFLGEGQLPLHELLEILENQAFHGPLIVDVRDLPDASQGARHAAHVLHELLQT